MPDTPLKIGICCHPTSGGSGVVATELGVGLARKGHKVHFFSYRMPFRLPTDLDNVQVHPVTMFPYPLFKYPPFCMAMASRIAEAIEDGLIDVIHAHYAIPHAGAALLARQISDRGRDVKVVTTLHGTDITLIGHDPSFRTATRFCIERSDAVTSVSEWLARETRERFDIRKQIDVITNFVDTTLFHPSAERLPVEQEIRCLHMSNFRPVKRVIDVVVAFEAMIRNLGPGKKAQLLFVGGGPDLGHAEDEIRRRGLSDKVRFLGERTDVADIFAACHLFFLPSEFESFGLAALEAMSCGAVPFSYRVGGLPEVVDDGVSGCLIEPFDAEAMGAAAAELVSHPARFDALSQGARRAACERFPMEAGIARYEALYRGIL